MNSRLLILKAQNCLLPVFFFLNILKPSKIGRAFLRHQLLTTQICYICCGTKTFSVSTKLHIMDTNRKLNGGKNVRIETF